MCYCGPAVHTLFISSTRMAGENDFYQIWQGGCWLGGGKCVHVHTFFFGLQYSMFMNFNMICLATEMAGGMKWETNLRLIPSAFY